MTGRRADGTNPRALGTSPRDTDPLRHADLSPDALRELPYAAYRRTKHWHTLRRQVKSRAGGTCERCGEARPVDVHHLTYERLGEELLDDLQALCRNCHREAHEELSVDGAWLRTTDGRIVGRVVEIIVEIPDELDAMLESIGDKGTSKEGLGLDVAVPEEQETPEKPKEGSVRGTIETVWDHYVAVMRPRKTTLFAQERTVIREALKVATEVECCGAIDGCARSPFHMGQNDRNRKYNTLSHILRGKRGIRTTREQIQFMLDLRDQPGSAFIPSEAAAEIAEAKRNVRQGVAFGGNEMARRKANEAMEVLRKHGIETHVEDANPPGSRGVTFIGG